MRLLTLLLACLLVVGCGPTPVVVHHVDISWTVPDPTGVTVYTVYRGTAPGQTDTELTNTALTSFRDMAVQAGMHYYYTVVSWFGDQTGVRVVPSPKSNEVVATIPN
jgi:fibronectin type 3 domain-containing protein